MATRTHYSPLQNLWTMLNWLSEDDLEIALPQLTALLREICNGKYGIKPGPQVSERAKALRWRVIK